MIGVSADAITDQQTGVQAYIVDVSINGVLYEKDGSEVTVLPGMVASIDVLSGKRTILDYFWQPISEQKTKPSKNRFLTLSFVNLNYYSLIVANKRLDLTNEIFTVKLFLIWEKNE